MAFSRRTKFRNLDEVSTAMSKLDERISKAEGAGGFFETNRDVDVAGNNIKNLKIPARYNDAARYSDAMRYTRHSLFVNANTTVATGGAQLRYGYYHNSVGYSRSGATLVYVTPVSLQFKQMFFVAQQKSNTNNQRIKCVLSKDVDDSAYNKVASATIHSISTGQWTYRGSLVIEPYRNIIPAGNTLGLMIQVPWMDYRWFCAGVIVDFLVVDK
jgi:hypothetical protein